MEHKHRRYVVTKTHVEPLETHILCASNTTSVTFTITVKPTWDDQSGSVF